VKLTIERDRFVPGDRVRGRVHVEKGGLQEIQVGLLFREEVPDLDATTRQVLAPDFEGSGDIPAGAVLPFEIEVPADAPPNFKTKHAELFWEVVAATDRVGADSPVSQKVEIRAPL
jgi:hypothetical protein